LLIGKLACGLLLPILLLTGCDGDQLSQQNARLTAQLTEANDRVAELEKHLQEVRSGTGQQNEAALNQAASIIQQTKALTELPQFEYRVVSKSIDRPPHDMVVYVKGLNGRNEELEPYIIRAAIEFSDSKYARVSLWKDEQKALQYVQGNYDQEETLLGWSGFDARFGIIDNSPDKPRLIQSFSRDDFAMLEFGKYRSAE